MRESWGAQSKTLPHELTSDKFQYSCSCAMELSCVRMACHYMGPSVFVRSISSNSHNLVWMCFVALCLYGFLFLVCFHVFDWILLVFLPFRFLLAPLSSDRFGTNCATCCFFSFVFCVVVCFSLCFPCFQHVFSPPLLSCRSHSRNSRTTPKIVTSLFHLSSNIWCLFHIFVCTRPSTKTPECHCIKLMPAKAKIRSRKVGKS